MPAKDKILIVEDEKGILSFMTTVLSSNGYDVISANSGAKAITMVTSHCPDLVILDLGLPDMDGVEVLRFIREWTHLPIIVVSARTHERDKVEALDLGADDYVTKPFGTSELLARIRAMTRKATGSATNVFTCGDLSLDSSAHRVTRAGKNIELSAKEFAVLEFMIRNKGSVLSREAIENNVWSYDWEGGTNVVDVYMSYLRRKLDADFEKKLIHTVRGVGWVLRDDA